ncbi:hypothetical protein TRICI_000738 [Trichomonascus ciferrii]|uniref:glutaminase n=1 Tax=Trichomonascus ciferrii TaxID=44093 RepID=A0A642VBY6_9ASCO|nr:hypothetical protein TRICI_000738 [Trichomonascus ciferrii]
MTQDKLTIGVLALQGAFLEHVQHLEKARSKVGVDYAVLEVRTVEELAQCQALVIPGGESTSISLVAERSELLEPLRDFVKKDKKPVWGTCAGMILLAEEATRTKKDGQELIGGLDVRVARNHFGRQTDSFIMKLPMPFLKDQTPFPCVFIRAPIVEAIISKDSHQTTESNVRAPTVGKPSSDEVKVLGTIPADKAKDGEEKIIAVQQGNVFGISFHPELSADTSIHEWWVNTCVL